MGRDNCRFNELPHLVGFTHTGSIESWNAVHNKYANKNFFYRHDSMLVRGALAAIDNNANLKRSQKRDKDGKLIFDQASNRIGANWFLKKRMDKKDDSWRDAIAEMTLQVKRAYSLLFDNISLFLEYGKKKTMECGITTSK